MLPIKDFPGYYVSKKGEVWSDQCNPIYAKTKKMHKLVPFITNSGYAQVNLVKDKRIVHKDIHRLVAETFIPNPANKPQVNHKNGIKTDNCVQNLEWVTRSENALHSYRVLHQAKPKGMSGKFGKNCKLSKVVLQIKEGQIINKFYGTWEAMRTTGIHQACISACCLGKRHHAGGYQWKYINEPKKQAEGVLKVLDLIQRGEI